MYKLLPSAVPGRSLKLLLLCGLLAVIFLAVAAPAAYATPPTPPPKKPVADGKLYGATVPGAFIVEPWKDGLVKLTVDISYGGMVLNDEPDGDLFAMLEAVGATFSGTETMILYGRPAPPDPTGLQLLKVVGKYEGTVTVAGTGPGGPIMINLEIKGPVHGTIGILGGQPVYIDLDFAGVFKTEDGATLKGMGTLKGSALIDVRPSLLDPTIPPINELDATIKGVFIAKP